MRSALVALVASITVVACSADRDRPGIVVSPDMAFSVPYDPYDPSPITDNGATLRLPPEGTVPVDGVRFDYGPTPPRVPVPPFGSREEADRAGRELFNPYVADKPALARGKHVYETFCLVCHGTGGAGDGPIIGRFPNPPSLVDQRPAPFRSARNLPDGALFHIITRGQGIMASYAVQVRPNDRWLAILYIRSLQGAK